MFHRALLAFVLTMGCGGASADAEPGETGREDARSDTPSSEDAASSADSLDIGAGDGATDDSSASADGSGETSADVGGGAGADLDLDGLADADEAAWANAYLPYVSIHPSDGCATHGIAYRVAPHPSEKGRIMIWYDMLYDADCGAMGHVGDDEMFGVVIDPAKPAPGGILAERAISHQGTPCEHVSTCGRCAGMTGCTTATRLGKDYPTIFPSKDKHGNYVSTSACSASFFCDFGGCTLSSAADAPAMVNAGEPGHPLVHDLTTEGFVTTANGWKNAELMHFDPWKPGDFGGAGDVSKDLVDPSFVVDTTACK
jgi:hypothetical protein